MTIKVFNLESIHHALKDQYRLKDMLLFLILNKCPEVSEPDKYGQITYTVKYDYEIEVSVNDEDTEKTDYYFVKLTDLV